MRTLRLAVVFLALAAIAGAQQIGVRPPGGSSGGGLSFPLAAGDGCFGPPYAFASETDLGMCRGLAANFGDDSLVLKSADLTPYIGNFIQMTEDGHWWFAGTSDASFSQATLYMQNPNEGNSQYILSALDATGTQTFANIEGRALSGDGRIIFSVRQNPGPTASTYTFEDDQAIFDINSNVDSDDELTILDTVLKAEVPLDLEDPGAKPACDATHRGWIFMDEGAAGVADTLEVCAKNSGDAYAWYPLATIP